MWLRFCPAVLKGGCGWFLNRLFIDGKDCTKQGKIPRYLQDVENGTVCYYSCPALDATLLNSACILK